MFLFSGGTALVYQVTWLRELSLIFGASFYATSIVLASFMGGLALGGFSAGRISGRLSRPLATYGVLEIAIAVFAMLLPTLLGNVDDFYVSMARDQGAVTPLLNAVRFTLAFGVLLLPTFFMGATLPVLIRFMVHAYGELGTRLALLYGINTIGAAMGAVVAGFILLPNLGNTATQQVAVISNFVIGVLAIAADFLAGRPATETSEALADEQAISDSPDLGKLPLQLTFLGTGITGMTALALEVLWTRAISVIIGSTTYSFTIMLAAFLTGIWIGSWLHASFPLRKINDAVKFGAVMVAIGVTSFVTSQLIPRVPTLVLWLNKLLYEDYSQIQTGTSLLGAFAVMLIPCIFMGIAFPIASQARARLKLKFGESVGDTLALNTSGSILGSLGAGFVLIPLVGLQGGMILSSTLAAAFGIVVLASAAAAGSTRRNAVLAIAVVLAVLIVVVGPLIAPRWDLERLATFNHDRIQSYYAEARNRVLGVERKLVHYDEGRSSTVAVVDTTMDSNLVKDNRRTIAINGKIVATDGSGDMDTQLLLGHVPVLLHPDPENVLVIGFGAGVTLGAVSAHKDIEEITLVEIEPAVLEAGNLFAHVNDNVLEDDPRLEIVVQDGRNFVQTTDRKFDVITADPVHPWAAGSAYLYTAEYYASAASRLKEGGIMCQWVPLGALSLENFRSIVGTFAQNFVYVSVWNTATDFALIGSNSPFRLTVTELSERLAEPDVSRQLNWVGLNDSESFLARLAVETTGVKLYTEEAIINTDDNLYLEFSSPLQIGINCGTGGPSDLCGMESWYPSRIEMVADWQPLFPTARAATAGLKKYRAENPVKFIKDLPQLPRATPPPDKPSGSPSH